MFKLKFQIDTLVNPLKSSMKTVTQAVKTMPDNMISTVDGVMDKLFGSAKKNDIIYESVKVGASLDTEVKIPLKFSTAYCTSSPIEFFFHIFIICQLIF